MHFLLRRVKEKERHVTEFCLFNQRGIVDEIGQDHVVLEWKTSVAYKSTLNLDCRTIPWDQKIIGNHVTACDIAKVCFYKWIGIRVA